MADAFARAVPSRTALMVTFQFPPQAGTSGVQRALRFVQDLAPLGWASSVLTVHASAYEETATGDHPPLPAGTTVHRSFAPDAKRLLSIGGRYPGFVARPDRWLAWVPLAVAAGLRIIRRDRPSVIWSSYPVPSAHLVAYWLSRCSNLPWVADFRDPMAHDGYPADPALWQSFHRVERRVFARASKMVFTTPGAAALYRQRFAARAADCTVIANGFDEMAFRSAETLVASAPAGEPGPSTLRLLHSGIIYPQWRDPDGLFRAVALLRRAEPARAARLRIDFRASGFDGFVMERAQQHGVADLLRLLPPLPYVEALADMLRADVLLAMQARSCNDQIPAKIYEYLRAGRPLLGLADPLGDTGRLLTDAGLPYTAALEDPAAILSAMQRLLDDLDARRGITAAAHVVAAASRQRRATELAALFDAARVHNT